MNLLPRPRQAEPPALNLAGAALAALALASVLVPTPAHASVYPETAESRAAREAKREKEGVVADRRIQRFEAAFEQVSNPRASHRGLAAQAIALQTFPPDGRPADLEPLAYWMRRDPDAAVARWGEVIVARLEHRQPDPELVPPYEPTPEHLTRKRLREEALLAAVVGGTQPEIRRSAIHDLMRTLENERTTSELMLLEALTRASADADSRVSSYARFMLKSLAGDPHAAGCVYVRGESLP